MLKVRLIPILLMREGILVKSLEFKKYFPIGNPKVAIEYFNAWDVDEIIFLDISPGKEYTQGRLDINLDNFKKLNDYTKYISAKCFVPLTVGGGISTLADINKLLHSGADKVTLNTVAFKNPDFVTKASKKYGRQCIVVSIDAKKKGNQYEVYTNCGKTPTGWDPVSWAQKVVQLGAGEILIQSIDKDGTQSGYDVKLISSIASSVNVPIIACSGVGSWDDLADGVLKGHADAVAAANIFHFTEHSTKHAKERLKQKGINVR